MDVRHFRHTASSYLIIGSLSYYFSLTFFFILQFQKTISNPIPCRCSLKFVSCSCELFSSKIEFFRSDITIHTPHPTHRHTHTLEELKSLIISFSHNPTQFLGISWKNKKTMCVCPHFFFFFLIMWIFIWYSLHSFVYSLRALTKWSYVRYTIDQSRDAFPHFFGKMNLNSISTFHFLLNVRVCEFVYFVIWFRHCKEKFKK
jgi:hypothetical protein